MIPFDRLDQKKNELQYLPKELYRNLNKWYCVEATYTSNAIEGSTLSREETALVIEKGVTGESKPLIDYLDAVNHAKAFEFVLDLIENGKKVIYESMILDIHRYVLQGLNNSNAGKYRNIAVRVRGSTTIFPNPIKIPLLMNELILWLKNDNQLHPIELAALAHYKLVSIHPFVDGNGRTARLLMNLVLGLNGFPPAIIEIEKKNMYFKILEKAQTTGNLEDFLLLIYKAVKLSLDDYLGIKTEKERK